MADAFPLPAGCPASGAYAQRPGTWRICRAGLDGGRRGTATRGPRYYSQGVGWGRSVILLEAGRAITRCKQSVIKAQFKYP